MYRSIDISTTLPAAVLHMLGVGDTERKSEGSSDYLANVIVHFTFWASGAEAPIKQVHAKIVLCPVGFTWTLEMYLRITAVNK